MSQQPGQQPPEPPDRAAEGEPEEPRITTHLSELASGPRMDWPDEAAPRMPLTKAWVPAVTIVVLFVCGFFGIFLIPLVGVLIGLVLLWRSPLWTRQEQIIGTVVVPLGLIAFLPVSAANLGDGGTAFGRGMAAFAMALASGVLIWLFIKARRRVSRFD